MKTLHHILNYVEPAEGVTLWCAGNGRVALHPFTGQADQAAAYLGGISSMPLDTERSFGRVKGWLGHDLAVVKQAIRPSA